MRPLVSAFAAPVGEALVRLLLSKAEVAAKPISGAPAIEKEEVEVVGAQGGVEEEGGVVPKLEVSVLELKARIEAGVRQLPRRPTRSCATWPTWLRAASAIGSSSMRVRAG